MSRYIGYLYATLFKRAFIYITLSFYAMFTIGIDFVFGKTQSGYTTYVNSFVGWFGFIFCVVFITLVIIHAFKKQELEGVELLVAAKPIARKNIIFGKIIVVLGLLIAFCLFVFVVNFIGAQFDNTSAQVKFKYAASMFLGTIVTGLLMTSIVLLLGSVMSKTGLLITSFLFAIGIFILNMSIVPSLGAYTPSIGYLTKAKDDGGGKYESIFENQENGTITFNNIYNKNGDKLKNNTNSSYKYIRFIDIWGQWGNVYQVISSQPKGLESNKNVLPTTQRLQTKSLIKNNLPIINSTNSNYDYIYNFSNDILDHNQNSVTIKAEIEDEVISALTKISSFVPTSKVNADVDSLFNIVKADQDISAYIAGGSNQDINEAVVKRLIVKNMFTSVTSLATQKYDPDLNSNYMKIVDYGNYVIITGSKPFINPIITGSIWTIISIALVGWAILVYLRRDFK